MTRREIKYLEECASACPYCGAGGVRRVFGPWEFRPESRPAVLVGCYCGPCGRAWGETYRLESSRIVD